MPRPSGERRAATHRLRARTAGDAHRYRRWPVSADIPAGPSSTGGGHAEPAVVTMVWDQVTDALLAHLARYVVVSRAEPGCRNIDLCASVTTPGRVTVIEKWANPATQQAHLDGPALLTLATGARGLGAARPAIELLEGISAYDLA